MAKKLEQKPKGEGIPTTAKVSISRGVFSEAGWGGILQVLWVSPMT